MMWFITHWKLAAIGAVLMASFMAGWMVKSNLAETRLKTALELQQTVLRAECQADKAITKGIADEYHAKNTALNARVARLNKLHAATCIPVSHASGSPGANGTAGNTQPVRPSGITVESIIPIIATGDKYALRLMLLQGFVNKYCQ